MSERLLLVDDEDGIRRFLGLLLGDLGYEVRTAANGEEALAVFEAFRPAIVLTDIKMPGMDGLELLRRIKAAAPETEVVMISGHGDMELAVKSLQLDAADFVTKPINEEILDAALTRVSEKLAMRRQIADYTKNLEQLVAEKSRRVVELERELAAAQVVDALCKTMRSLAEEMRDGETGMGEMPCFIAVHNRHLEVVTANQLYRERLGDPSGRASTAVYAEQASRGEMNPVRATFATGRGQRSLQTFLDKDGQPLTAMVYTSPVRHQNGEVELVLEMAVDQSEILRLREELRFTQQKWQDLFDETPCYIAVRDRDFRIKASNRKFKDDFGEGVGSFCYQAFKHREEPCAHCPVQRTFVDGQSHPYESVVTTKDGRRCNVLSWSAPIRNAKGEIVEVMEMATDITRIRELQDHLTSLGLMLGSLSHGVKGMLTALDGGVYRLESGLAKGDMGRVTDATQTVKTLVARIRTLVLNVLYYAKSRDLQWVEADAADFARGVARIIEPKAAREKIAFTVAIPDDAGSLEADTGNLSAALVNILENAIDACTADSSKAEHAISFKLTSQPDAVVLTIEDNGMGMDRETREKAFTLFFSSKGLKGTGLGLFIAHEVVAKHKGRIELDSEPGRGTRFTVRLPRVLPEALKRPAA